MVPREKSTPSVDIVKWALVVVGFIILVLSFSNALRVLSPASALATQRR